MQRTLRSTRDAYGEALLRLGEANPNVVVLDADLSSSTRTGLFAARFPERFFDVGIAEQNLYGVAAGLAACGKIVFASTFAVFATERALNQIRQSIAYPGLNVKIACSHAGFTASGDGGSHQTLIDVSLMRCLPNMTVVVPADAVQTELAVEAAARLRGPVYLRLGKTEVPILFERQSPFQIGKAILMRPGADVTVLAAGILLERTMLAVERAGREGISAELLNVHTVKPLDEDGILRSVRKTAAAVTVEEHSVVGGLGGAVAELLAGKHPAPLECVGVQDVFGESGSEEELYARHGLTVEGILAKIQLAVARKRSSSSRVGIEG